MSQQSQLVHPKETLYFILCVVLSSIVYLAAAISIVGLIIIAGFILISLVINAFFIGSIRGNGVRLSESQFPEEYRRIEELSNEMGLNRVPDVFIMQSEGMLNAFATRFFGRNIVVLYSEVFDLARQKGEKELEFIIAHELAHVKRRHVLKHWLILPSMWMPFLGEAYLRAAEYTCDRHAAFYIQDGKAAKNALKILAVGKQVYTELNEDAYLRQIEEESNPFVWFAEKLSSHPTLPKRIQQVGFFMLMEETPNYQPNRGKVALKVIISLVALSVLWLGVVAGVTYILSKADFASILEEEDYFDLEETELMEAAWTDDPDRVEELLYAGESIDDTDYEGSTALHYAVYGESIESAELLLAYGADPNAEDDTGALPLVIAYQYDLYDIAELLLEYGADPALEPFDGTSAMQQAIYNDDRMFIQLFEQYE